MQSEFTTRYEKLNTNQKKAVDTIEGPLLIVAGPGTGKTELLSMRTANILRQTDTLPSTILCLTFTESGAVNMRKRLREIIGEDAYKVAIQTFHGFGVEIINQHRQYFFRGAEFRPADELAQYELLRGIFEELEWNNPIASKNGDEFVYLKDSLSIISELKRSGLVSEEVRKIIEANQLVIDQVNAKITEVFAERVNKSTAENLATVARIVADIDQPKLPSGITPYSNALALSIAHAVDASVAENTTKPITAWKNQWCTKDSRGNTVLKDGERTEKLHALNYIYSQYISRMAEAQLYDYDDMILNVIHAVETNPELRANLQEQYQYIMVDEFQDTNLAQLRLLFNIATNDKPNIMAVGDDDQAIFSFQGADISNIHRFRQELHEPPIIVLTDNYRSTEPIIASARNVISQGTDRLEQTIEGLSKKLTTHSPEKPVEVDLVEYSSITSERDGIARAIAGQIEKDSIAPESIAIIARRHHELIALLPYLEKYGVAVNYERQDNALEHPLIELLELLSQVAFLLHKNQHDAVNSLLPELLSHPGFGFHAKDIWKLSLAAWRNKQQWLETMQTMPAFEPVAGWLIERSKAIHSESLEEYIDTLIGVPQEEKGAPDDYTSPLYSHFFSEEVLAKTPDSYLSALEALRTIRGALREHYDVREPKLDMFLDFITTHRELGTRLTITRQRSDATSGQVNLLTAHKAKGLEYDYVHIIHTTDNVWGEKVRSRSRLISYPANLQLQPPGDSYNERLRLFFVAMTRARKQLSVSYAKEDSNAKPLMVASFLSQQPATPADEARSVAEEINLAKIDWHTRLTAPLNTDLKSLLASTLDNYKLSVTHLNNFLDVSRGGPQTFLLNNLLRFPQGKSPAASYGTAIHAVLSKAHVQVATTGQMKPIEDILGDFERILGEQGLPKDEFDALLAKGIDTLNTYLSAKSGSFTASQRTELSFAGQGAVVQDARLTGALDVVDIDKTNKTIQVTDYKTGRPSRDWKGRGDYEKIKLHKYRQQLLFYQLLVEHSRDYHNYQFTGATLQFVEPEQGTGDILALEDSFDREELERFERLIQAVWQKITNLDLPDVSKYSPDYKGMLQFEAELLQET